MLAQAAEWMSHTLGAVETARHNNSNNNSNNNNNNYNNDNNNENKEEDRGHA